MPDMLHVYFISLRSQFIKKRPHRCVVFFMSMGYEKDIFGSFVYEFELSHEIQNHPRRGYLRYQFTIHIYLLPN